MDWRVYTVHRGVVKIMLALQRVQGLGSGVKPGYIKGAPCGCKSKP